MSATAVLHVGGLHYAGEKAAVERVLGQRPGVQHVEANPVAQTAPSGSTRRRRPTAAMPGCRLPLKRLGLPPHGG